MALRTPRILATGLVVLVLSGTAGLAAVPVDVMTNGGFEGGLTGWKPAPEHSLVKDAAQAHSGSACLTGEVTALKKALFLRRPVPVKKGNMYELEFWAKGTRGTKIVLFVTQPGTSQRKHVAHWDKLARQWRRYKTPVSVAASGTLELQIVAPSSHAASPGQVWIDDVAFYERTMPPVARLTEGKFFNDAPAMAAAADGSFYAAWISFRDGADSLQVARLRPKGKGLERLGAWQVVGGKGTYVLGPRALAAGANVVLMYAAEADGNWDVYAVTCAPDGPGEPVRLRDRKSTRLNSSHIPLPRMPSSA